MISQNESILLQLFSISKNHIGKGEENLDFDFKCLRVKLSGLIHKQEFSPSNHFVDIFCQFFLQYWSVK